jgi:very-short-patch-repair endonuclease
MRKTTSRIRGTNPATEAAAKRLRKSMTPAEQKLWQALRVSKLSGLKFRRQHPVGNFIVDFFCPEHKLVIELDGGVHDQQQNYDIARSEKLHSYGYRVIRFRNEEVLADLEAVLEQILQTVASKENLSC